MFLLIRMTMFLLIRMTMLFFVLDSSAPIESDSLKTFLST